MAQWKSLGGGAGLALLLGTTAQADVTAAEVWQSWQDFSANMGQTMTAGSEEMSGDTLTVTDVSMSAEMPDGSMTGSLGFVKFKELGDGTVEISMSEEYPLVVTTEVEGEDPVEVAVTVTQKDVRMIASGDATALSYDFSSPEMGVVLDSITGAPEGGTFTLNVAIKGIVGKYLMTPGEIEEVETEFSADSLSMDVTAADPATSGEFTMKATVDAIESFSTLAMAADTDLEDMAAALEAGFATEGSFTYGKIAATFDFKDATSSGNMVSSVASGGIEIALDQDELTYGVTSNGADITLVSSDMPFPQVNAKIAESGFLMTMPVSVSEEPQAFSLVTKLVDLTVSDEIWGMFDPGAVLPRDPATLIVDLAGEAKWLVDIFAMDPEAPSEEVPGELSALTLNQLKLTVGGADLSGTGAFTFDNTDTTTFPGMPKPAGSIDVTLVGGNGLLDKLVLMGLLPEDQAMGAKMMMGMFGRVTEGAEDTLTSQIEMKEDGSIFANGQQIQ